jgi:hypothetical protein
MEGRALRVARLEWLRQWWRTVRRTCFRPQRTAREQRSPIGICGQMSVAVVASHYRAKGSGRARRVLSATGAIRDPGRVMVEMM